MNFTRRVWLLAIVSALFLAGAGPASRPAAAQTGYGLTFLRKVGSSAGSVLALSDGVAFSEGSTLRLYDPTGANLLGSLTLPCGIGGLGLVGNTIIASTCDGLAVINITNRTAPALVRAMALDPAICPLEEEAVPIGVAASGDYAYVGLWTSGCVLNWQTGQTLSNIGEWVTDLQVYQGHLFTLEEHSTYDEEVVVHSGLPAPVVEDEVEVQYYTNDFAVAADKVFSTATGPENAGLCAAAWDPDPSQSGARLDCLYTDDAGATGVAAAADSVRGDNVFTVRSGQLRWVKSAGETDLAEVASAPYAATVNDLGTGGGQYVYAAGSDGLSIFRFQHPAVAPPPDPAPNYTQSVYLPLARFGP